MPGIDFRHRLGCLALFLGVPALGALLWSAEPPGRKSGPGLILPSKEQADWQDREVGLFCHFGLNTFHNLEWSDGTLDPRSFNPTRLHPEQWVKVAQDMGARYLVLTAKHHDGFCLWPTETTDYSVKSSPYKGGKGDVVGEVVAACRQHHLPVGLYLSPWDRHEPKYRDKKAYDLFYAQQLTELVTRYGPLVELWFDGAGSEGREYDWPSIMAICKKYQPQAMIFNMGQPTIRWAGNENGTAPYPLWNVVPAGEVLKFAHGKGKTDGHGTVWLPAECDVPLRRGWFYHTDNEGTIKSLGQLMDIYEKSVGRGANLLLNVAPDRDGLIPEKDAQRAREFGDEVRHRFGTPLASSQGEGTTVELTLPRVQPVNYLILQEDIRQGERIRRYTVEAEVGGRWQPVAEGTSVGHKKIDRVRPVETSKLRLRVTEAVAPPVVRNLAAYGTP